jgi:DNA-directed RNA polymerase subunit F
VTGIDREEAVRLVLDDIADGVDEYDVRHVLRAEGMEPTEEEVRAVLKAVRKELTP